MGRDLDKIGPQAWPENYETLKQGVDCKFCDRESKGPKDWIVQNWLRVWVGEASEVYLERRANRLLPGYSVALWRHGHVAEPFEAPAGLRETYWREVTALAQAVRQVFTPIKLNIASMGSIAPHLHTYVFPRYPSDPAPGENLPWRALYEEPRFSNEELQEHAAAIRAQLDAAMGSHASSDVG